LRYQVVYTAAEIAAANGAAGNITHLGWYVTQVPLYNLPNYTISMKHTTATDAATHDGTGLTTVYNNASYAPAAGGFDMLTLQTPFAWNGTDNILVDICFDQVTPTYDASGQTRMYSVTNGARYSRNDSAPQCGVSTATAQTVKPQVQFAITTTPPPPPPPPTPGVVTLGTGTTTNATTVAGPVNIYYRSLRYQTVYTAAEIAAANGTAGNITHLGWYVTQAPLYAMPNYTIKIKHTTATDAAVHDDTGLTTVYTNANYAPVAGGFDMLAFQTPFTWNGTDNILVDICFDQTVPTYNSSGQTRVYSATNGARYSRNDDVGQCGATTITTQTTKAQVRLNIATVTPPPPPVVDSCLVSWTSLQQTTVKQSGRRLQKTVQLPSGFTGSAISVDHLPDGDDGWVEMEALLTNKRLVYGLAWYNTDADKSSIRFGVELHTTAVAYVSENGTRKHTIGIYAIGDKFRIVKADGVVKYYHNGTLVYTSTKNPTGAYYADASIQSFNGTVYNAFATFCGTGSAGANANNSLSDLAPVRNELEDVTAYPNPFEDNITVNYAPYTEAIESIELYNINGQHIRTIDISADGQTVINTLDLQSGVYIIAINGTKHLKVVKM
jgi:hypothetical protein